MRAWLFQDHRQKERLGGKCPWSVGWLDPEGKRKSKRIGSKSNAEKYARKIEGQLASGTYESATRKNWSQFRADYEKKVMAGMEPGTRDTTRYALDHFERIIKPARIQGVTTRTIADYVAARRLEPYRRSRPRRVKAASGVEPIVRPKRVAEAKAPPRAVSPATVNRELRHLRAAIRKAHKWGYLPKLPEFEFLREPGKLPTYVTPEHFAALYGACDATRWPDEQHYPAGDWWRGLFVMAYMTGWRVGSLLSLRWEDVDLDRGTALSRAADNKGKRDQLVPLHQVVIEHLRPLVTFAEVVFPWSRGRRSLFKQLNEIQAAAKVQPIGKPHYGFHDLRRAFATMNADKLTPDALQALMQHKDYQTTQRYINMARQLNPAVANLFVPSLPKTVRV